MLATLSLSALCLLSLKYLRDKQKVGNEHQNTEKNCQEFFFKHKMEISFFKEEGNLYLLTPRLNAGWLLICVFLIVMK